MDFNINEEELTLISYEKPILKSGNSRITFALIHPQIRY